MAPLDFWGLVGLYSTYNLSPFSVAVYDEVGGGIWLQSKMLATRLSARISSGGTNPPFYLASDLVDWPDNMASCRC